MAEVGIRGLRQDASSYVARAAAGEDLIVTDRGRPVARLVPYEESTVARLRRLGRLRGPAGPLADLLPPSDDGEVGTAVSDALSADRDDARL